MSFFSFLRPRFSIRALLVVMTLVAIFFFYHLNWIHQRRAAIDAGWVNGMFALSSDHPAPGLLWIFGERGYATLIVVTGDDRDSRFNEAAVLFPEAILYEVLSARVNF